MRRIIPSLVILVAACAAQPQPASGPVALGEQLQCGVAIASAAGYSASVSSDYNRAALPPDCVAMEDSEGFQTRICERVQNDTVYVSATRPSRRQQTATAEMGLVDRIARSCPPRPLRK